MEFKIWAKKVNNQEVLIRFGVREYFQKYVGNPHIYLAPKSDCFIAACSVEAQEALFNA